VVASWREAEKLEREGYKLFRGELSAGRVELRLRFAAAKA